MPKINHIILSWARETSELSVEDAAHKLQIKDGKNTTAADKLLAYETGAAVPTRSMLIRMTKIYRRPLLTFYLDRPPGIADRGEDFRTLPDHFEKQENVYVDVLIRDVKARQKVIRQTLIDEDEEVTLGYVGGSNVDQGVEHITQVLREVLRLDVNDFRSSSTYSDAFRLLRQHAEQAGIFVLLQGNLGSHHTDIDVATFRGFALSDRVAPFIVINDRDAKSAWSFTLLHEMAHLVLGQTGVSGAYAEKEIEKFCNNVASEYLLPSSEFNDFKVSDTTFESLKSLISDYAFSMKVSNSHIAYRLFKRNDIEEDVWQKLRTFYQEQWHEQRRKLKEQQKEQDGGPSYYVVRRYKLGTLVNLVQRFTYSGALSTTKAGMLLNVRPLKVHRLFEDNHLT